VTSRNPVRVIRGAGLNNDYAPEYGYRYDGELPLFVFLFDCLKKNHVVLKNRIVHGGKILGYYG